MKWKTLLPLLSILKKWTTRDCLRARTLWDGARQSTTAWADLGSMDTGQRRLSPSCIYSPMNQILLRAQSYIMLQTLDNQKGCPEFHFQLLGSRFWTRALAGYTHSAVPPQQVQGPLSGAKEGSCHLAHQSLLTTGS